MIEEKTRLLHLLDDYISADGLTIVIGSEHSAPDLQRFSLVVSSYSDGRTVRAVGVIGPTADALLEGDQRRRLVVQGHQPDGRLASPDPRFAATAVRSLSTTRHGRQSARYGRRLGAGGDQPGDAWHGRSTRWPSSSASATTTTI